jgi:hypothetical protein
LFIAGFLIAGIWLAYHFEKVQKNKNN